MIIWCDVLLLLCDHKYVIHGPFFFVGKGILNHKDGVGGFFCGPVSCRGRRSYGFVDVTESTGAILFRR